MVSVSALVQPHKDTALPRSCRYSKQTNRALFAETPTSVCHSAFSGLKIMTVQNKSSVTEERPPWLVSKFALGRRVTPKAFKQIFHSQEPFQVSKCSKEHLSDPEFCQICYELKFLDGSILTYIHVFMLELKQKSSWKMRTLPKNSITKAPWWIL